VQRWWNLNVGNPRDMIHVVADGTVPKVFASQAVLGLSPGESRLSSIAKVIGTEKFGRLENGEQNIIYLSSAIADQLKVKEGDKVKIGGIELQIAGIFDADDFDQRVTTLSNEPLAPLKYSSGGLDASGRRLDNNEAESLDLDADSTSSELASAYEHLSATQFVIVPFQVSKLLPGATLRSLAFDLPTTATTLAILPEAKLKEFGKSEQIAGHEAMSANQLAAALAKKNTDVGLTYGQNVSEALVKVVSDDLSKRLAVAMFAGFNDGVKLVSAGSGLPQVSGAGQVAVPLAIAGLIIFNTMMGSIAERRREIHVYTSLGLAPVHVGALFVAEAMTYGLIGTVFGYVIGQGVGTAMSKFGLLGSVTLNYSGTSAMVTMGLILLITLLSALVPARLASKIAAPSIERSWKVPLPKGDEIMAILPFTINKTAADGALAYLADFFDAHREGSIGKFSAGKVDAFVFSDEKGNQSRGLKTIIWLTPFDLGVRQHLMLLIHPGSFPDVYEVQVVLGRLSGDDGNWYRMNRSFLTELRKQFLQWRSLSPQRQLEFVEQSRKLFAEAVKEVVPTEPGEQVRMA
jgi:ABC-type antimicrobial peptide transport system permease subunit